MWRKLLSKNFIPYTITLLVIAVDFAIVMMVTLWTPEFTLDKLSTADFWLTQALKTLVALVAYFIFIYFGSTIMKRTKEMEMLKYQVQQHYDFVNLNLLSDAKDNFVDYRNNLEKAKAYLNYLDQKLRLIKTPENNEKKLLKLIKKGKLLIKKKSRCRIYLQNV